MNKATTRRLVKEIEQSHASYKGWTWEYFYPGFFSYYKGALRVFFTPDHNERGKVGLEIQADDVSLDVPEDIDKRYVLSADGIVGIARRLMDHVDRVTYDSGVFDLDEFGSGLGGPWPGYASTETWNGFARPVFDEETAAQIAAAFRTVPRADGASDPGETERLTVQTTSGARTVVRFLHVLTWNRGDDAQELAARFATHMRASLTLDQLAEANKRNAHEKEEVCHTADYCDANMVMLAAWEDAGLHMAKLGNQGDLRPGAADLWNRAWSIAKASGFSLVHEAAPQEHE